jgi:ABC-type lipoprotein release transport system permease subunit
LTRISNVVMARDFWAGSSGHVKIMFGRTCCAALSVSGHAPGVPIDSATRPVFSASVVLYLEVAAIPLASSLAATWIPAARATRVEPAITLRGD